MNDTNGSQTKEQDTEEQAVTAIVDGCPQIPPDGENAKPPSRAQAQDKAKAPMTQGKLLALTCALALVCGLAGGAASGAIVCAMMEGGSSAGMQAPGGQIPGNGSQTKPDDEQGAGSGGQADGSGSASGSSASNPDSSDASTGSDDAS